MKTNIVLKQVKQLKNKGKEPYAFYFEFDLGKPVFSIDFFNCTYKRPCAQKMFPTKRVY